MYNQIIGGTESPLTQEMTMTTTTTTLTGTTAIAFAREHGLTLCTYATDLEPAGQSGLTPDQAEAWIAQEPGHALESLVYLPADTVLVPADDSEVSARHLLDVRDGWVQAVVSALDADGRYEPHAWESAHSAVVVAAYVVLRGHHGPLLLSDALRVWDALQASSQTVDGETFSIA